MNEVENYGGDENLSFRQMVLSYMRRVMELNLKLIPQENNLDFAKCYKRAVLGLNDILLPFFDDDMTYAYNRALDDFDEMMRRTTDNGEKITDLSGYIGGSMKIFRELFRQLNLLLNRNDYLKNKVYGEDSSEVIEGDSE